MSNNVSTTKDSFAGNVAPPQVAATNRGSSIRWPSDSTWVCQLVFGLLLFFFLDGERKATVAKVKAVVEARHALRDICVGTICYRNLDAVSNLEHALFGFCCAFAGYLMARGLHGLDPSSTLPVGWASPIARTVRRILNKAPGAASLAGIISRIRSAVPQRGQSASSARKRCAVVLFVRLACSIALVAALLGFRHVAYGKTDVIAGIYAFIVGLWLIWGWKHALMTAAQQPEFVILVFGGLFWLEFDLAWKIVQIGAQKNTLVHAARHLSYSLATFFVSAGVFRLVVMRRRTK